MGLLRKKVAIVTGASRGIGRATAQRLANDGATVVVNYAVNRFEAEKVVKEIISSGGKAIAMCADISNIQEIERLFQDTKDQFGSLDIFIANAGYSSFAALIDCSEEEFDRTFKVNAKGTFFCLQQAAKHMADNGRIVCVSTIGTQLNMLGGACYFGTKAAVEQYCRVLAKELAPRQINVNVVSPGFTDTDMLTAAGGKEPDAAREILNITPLARLGQPQEIANTIAFLVGPDGRWVNRQNLPADGGIISR